MNLADVINQAKEREVYEATFAINEHWHITKSIGFFWYCDENGEVYNNMSAVPLTYSNLRADYELV